MTAEPGSHARQGPFAARLARSEADRRAAQALRHACFVAARGLPSRPGGLDRDRHDAGSLQVLVEDAGGRPAATLRLRVFAPGADLRGSRAGQSYDLAGLSGFPAPLAEVGRLCVRPGLDDPDALRMAWGALAALADADGVGLLFGCPSFEGTDPTPYQSAFALLRARHLGPAPWRPRAAATAEIVPFGHEPPADRGAALRRLPPALRSYLAMGGWTGDHAVTDRRLGTLHVFTAVEVARLPAARAAGLRRLGEVAAPRLTPPRPAHS